MIDNMKKRRSHRSFTSKEVDDALLREIIDDAMRAPTTGNMQLYTVIVSRKGPQRKELEKLHFQQPASTGADVLLTVCADFNRFSRWCRLSGADPGYDNLLSLASAVLDATILTQQIATIAELKGLGTCYLGTVTYNAEAIADLLELPTLVVPVCCLAIGWPDGEGAPSERLPLDAVLAFDKYPKFSDDEIISLYKAKDDFPENRQFVEENGKDSLAQVFTDIRYPRELNEQVSRALLKYLPKTGFLPEL